MNKKSLLAMLVLSGALCGSVSAKVDGAPKNTGSQEGTISFQGYIYSATCTIDVTGSGSVVSDGNPIIDMGRYSTSEFVAPGDEVGGAGGKGAFNVVLTNCPDKGTLTMTLKGTAAPYGGSNSVLQLNGGDGGVSATGVGISLYHKNEEGLETRIPISGTRTFSSIFGDKDEETAKLTYSFLAKYIKISDAGTPVTAGVANADLPYEITYN